MPYEWEFLRRSLGGELCGSKLEQLDDVAARGERIGERLTVLDRERRHDPLVHLGDNVSPGGTGCSSSNASGPNRFRIAWG